MTSHPAHTMLVMPTATAPQVHADLVSAVAPQGERHFRADPTHSIREHDGRLWLAVSGHTASLSNQPLGSGPHWSEIEPIKSEEPLV